MARTGYRLRTTDAHWKMDPITQIKPAIMIALFLPIRSARSVAASAPTKDPAGIAATIAPCAAGLG